MFFDVFSLLRNLFCFMGSYSNEVFPEPLSNDEERKCVLNKMKGDSLARNKLIEHIPITSIFKKVNASICKNA